eukprot:m.936968 g.936968  ORF g.936968 m.936968 type:complete len:326 (-) comp23812_c0_seq21:384-1361(-)
MEWIMKFVQGFITKQPNAFSHPLANQFDDSKLYKNTLHFLCFDARDSLPNMQGILVQLCGCIFSVSTIETLLRLYCFDVMHFCLYTGQAYNITISVQDEKNVDFGFQSMTERAKWLEAIKIHLHKGLQPEYENLADNLSQLLAGTPAYSDNAEENAMATRHRTGDLSFEARAAREAVINDIRDKCQVASEFAAKKYAEFRQAWRQGQPMVVDDDKLMNERLQKIYKMLQYYVSASAYLESELLAVVVKCFYLVEQERMQEDVLRIRCITSFCNQYPSQEDLNNLFRVRDASYAHRRRVAAELVELYSGALTDIIALNEHSLAEFE